MRDVAGLTTSPVRIRGGFFFPLSLSCDHNRCQMVPRHVTGYEKMIDSFLPYPFSRLRRPPPGLSFSFSDSLLRMFWSLVFVWQISLVRTLIVVRCPV